MDNKPITLHCSLARGDKNHGVSVLFNRNACLVVGHAEREGSPETLLLLFYSFVGA